MNAQSLYKSVMGQQVVMDLYDRMLERWPVPCETRYVPTRHGDTFVIASGDVSAPPLVLLHGTCSNALAWTGDVSAYSRHFRVYAVDEIGEPGRSAAARPAWEGTAYADWLADVLDGLGVDRVSLLGMSQGGWIALKFATVRPERLERLVLLAPSGIAPARLSFVLRAVPLSMMGRRGAEAINRITFGAQPMPEEAVLYMNAIMTHFKPRISAMRMFSDDELRRLEMPVLLVAGARDALLPAERTAARLSRLAPHVTVRILPEAGHVLHGMPAEVLPFLGVPQSPAGAG